MSKILHIVVCDHCPNLKICILESTLKPALYCILSTKVIAGNSEHSIPKWCLLDDRPTNNTVEDRQAKECISGGACYKDKYCQCAGCLKYLPAT